jgi:Ca2+-binding RTX toxin-like protein
MVGGDSLDTVDYSKRTGDVVATLDDWDDDGEAAEGDNVGSDIENIETGSGNDQIVASDEANSILPGAGDDAVDAAGGDDEIDSPALDGADDLNGGAGTDIMSYVGRENGVHVTLDSGSADDGESGEGDTVTNFESVIGTVNADTLIGGPGNDDLQGIAGTDTLDGGPGNDRLTGSGDNMSFTGGPGDDDEEVAGGGSAVFHEDSDPNGADLLFSLAGGDSTVDYGDRSGDVSVSLDGLPNDGEAGEGDYVDGIHSILTGTGNDTITTQAHCDGAAGADHTYSLGLGDDHLVLGACAADVDGGLGADTLDYSGSPEPVALDLGAGTGTVEGHDQIVAGVETVVGSDFDDSLAGSFEDETLSGGNGDDQLHGAGGTDTLNGDEGEDTLDGGLGDDAENGGNGNDTFDQGTAPNGADELDGGNDWDLVDYYERSVTAAVTADDVADDGEPGENDNVHSNVEGSNVATFQTLSVTIDPSGTGTGDVTSEPAGIDCGATCGDDFRTNDVVTLTANPGAHSVFDHWEGYCGGDSPVCDVTMDQAQGVTAVFSLEAHTVSVQNSNPTLGSVASDLAGIDCGGDCADLYPYGTTLNLVATPAAGSRFNGWTGDCTGMSTTCQITVSADAAVMASFLKNTFRPDALIRTSTSAAFVGNNVYDARGTKAKKTVNAKRKTSKTFFMKFENNGNLVDSFKLKGAKSSGAFTVKYFVGSKNVTSQVTKGTYRTSNLAVNHSVQLKVVISVSKTAKYNSTKSFLVTAESVGKPGLKDGAIAAVKVVKH